jgi:hypothetical protein
MSLATEVPEHRDLPEGEWWACHYPERPATRPGELHWRPGCTRCWPSFQAAILTDPNLALVKPRSDTPDKLYRPPSPEEAQEWFFRSTNKEA